MSKEMIDVLIKAAYPLIYINTYEEFRVLKDLAEVATDRKRNYLIWSSTRGIQIAPNQFDENTADPMAVLQFIRDYKEPAIFVLSDFHPYMDDPMIVRLLKELAEIMKSQSKTIILVSPVIKIPVELEKQTTLVEWGFPAPSDISNLLDNILKDMKERLTVDMSNGKRESIIQASLGLTLEEIDNAIVKSLVVHKDILPDDIIKEKEQIIRKSGILEFFAQSETLNDVGGMNNLKDWLSKRAKAFTKKAKDYKLDEPKGIILLGVQGCGKSLICKASASLWNKPLLRLDIGKVFAGIVGSSEENMRKAIKTAEAISPCILWIDEIDKAFSGMQSSGYSDGGTSSRVFGSFLTWMQEKKSPVFVIATCNSIEQLPPELIRRFDVTFFVDLPSLTEREQIFVIHLVKRGRDPKKFKLHDLAGISDGFSGAEIEKVVVSAMYDAFDNDLEINNDHITKAIQTTVPLSTTMKESIGHLRSWATTRAQLASSVTQPITTGRRKVTI